MFLADNGHRIHAPRIVPRSASRKAAAKAVKVSAYERVLVRGKPIGDLWRGQFDGIMSDNWRVNALLNKCKTVALPRGVNDARIKDYIPEHKLSQFIAEVDGRHDNAA